MTESDNQVVDRSRSLYEHDFFAWTVQQAAALRRAAQAGTDPALDWVMLAEEVEDMGRSERRAVDSALVRVVEHLLKLEYSPAVAPRRGWADSAAVHRFHAIRHLRDSPSLRRRIGIAAIYEDALPLVVHGLRADGVDPGVLPSACPYTLEQVLDRAWWPANRHGVES